MLDSIIVETTAVETTVNEESAAAEPLALATVHVKPDDGELMKLTQVPIIVERLRKIKGEVESRTSTAINLVVTESNYKEIKKVRSAMNKEFAELETKRKDIKKAVMTPYEQFEAVYKECVAVPYKAAEAELKKKIAVVEDDLKAEKAKKVREHFDKYAQVLGIDFVSFEAVGCQITMSVTENKLKEQCTAFLDRVMDDLQLIATQEHKAEILVEYKRSLNVSQAIRTVKERFEAIAAEKAREEAERAERERAAQNDATNEAAFEPFAANVPQEIEVPEGEMPEPTIPSAPAVEEQTYSLSFTIHGTRAQLKAAAQYIKEYLNKEGLRYE
jgi:hypothetical protein